MQYLNSTCRVYKNHISCLKTSYKKYSLIISKRYLDQLTKQLLFITYFHINLADSKPKVLTKSY